jgi:hypothetical protein
MAARVGIAPKLSDAELVTLAVMQALLGFTRYDLKLWTGTLHESATYPPA